MRFLEEMRLLICLGVLSLFACTSTSLQSGLTDETRKTIDSIVRVTPGIDSLSILLDRFEAEGNKYGMMGNRQIQRSCRLSSSGIRVGGTTL